MTATFTLAHLSDIHLAPVPWPRLDDLDAKRALGLANWHRKRKRQHGRDVIDALVADLHRQHPDHIAVGGDLVNLGLPAEIEAARIWLGTVGSPAKVSVVPGNHDVYGRLGTDPGIARWKAYMGGEGQFPFLRRFGPIAMICLNSAVPTPVFWASGRLGAQQREALAGLLAKLGSEGACRIVVLHHPPLPGQADRLRGLDDAQETADVLSRHGAELVLHGHNHQSTLRWLDGGHGRIPVVGVPSASGRPGFHAPAARYNLFSIVHLNSGWRISMTGRQYQGDGTLLEVERTGLNG
jgi:3',5'-cyclic AMP phosphodiesterase CpdA